MLQVDKKKRNHSGSRSVATILSRSQKNIAEINTLSIFAVEILNLLRDSPSK